MSVGHDDFLWSQCSSIAKEDEVFFNNWEEETTGITPERTYQAEFEMSKNMPIKRGHNVSSVPSYMLSGDLQRHNKTEIMKIAA